MANEQMGPYVLDFPDGERVDEILKKADANYSREEIDGKFDGLDLVGKTFEVEGKDSTGEIFNDYENNVANGDYAHAEGFTTQADGVGSHAEGHKSNARSQGSHAEGDTTDATAPGGHSEGLGSKSYGPGAHAEGICTEATNPGAHSEGSNRTYNINDGYANAPQSHGIGAHAEGHGRRLATGYGAHVEGGDGYQYYINNGKTAEEADNLVKNSRGAHTIYGHAEGMDTQVAGKGASHAEGMRTEAIGLAAHAEGFSDVTLAHFTEPCGTKEEIEALWKNQSAGTKFSCAFGDESHVEGGCNLATGVGAHAEGGWTLASGKKSHAEGSGTQATGEEAHAEGAGCEASGNHSHAEGAGTIASGIEAHAEGSGTKATGYGAHAEGKGCESGGDGSHAEGQGTRATSYGAHAEGGGTLASGGQSHAEGAGTTSSGTQSHAEGGGTTAYGHSSHAEGRSYTFPSTLEITSTTTNDEIINSWNNNNFSLAKGEASHIEGFNTLALGTFSHAEGLNSKAIGDFSHAENAGRAEGSYSHAEGQASTIGSCSHAEGGGTGGQYVAGGSPVAYGSYSHAEGGGYTISQGSCSHAEGASSEVNGWGGHSEGVYTRSSGDGAHAEGMYYVDSSVGSSSLIRTTANGAGAHAEGRGTYAQGAGSHAEGDRTKCEYTDYSHAEGLKTVLTYTDSAHAEGYQTSAILGRGHHIEGYSTERAADKISEFNPGNSAVGFENIWKNSSYSFSLACGTEGCHVEGKNCFARSIAAHAEGLMTLANGEGSHSEGYQTSASGQYSHAEGGSTAALGDYTHSEGNNTVAFGYGSYNTSAHAEGRSSNKVNIMDYITITENGYTTNFTDLYNNWKEQPFTLSYGNGSHAEGVDTLCNTNGGHTEGECTVSHSGSCGHAEGYHTEARYGTAVHAEGYHTIASGTAQHVQGKYNKVESSGKYAFIIGNGTGPSFDERSNAIAIDWDGKIYVNNSETGVDLNTLVGRIDQLGGGAEEFICNITADSFSTGSVNNWTSDKTFDELKNAYDSGKKVKVILNNVEECILAGRESYEIRYVCFTFGNSMGNPSSTVTMRWFNISSSGVLGRVGDITSTN